uniref:Protein arginine methyltransferase NDUFAF7 n=1 Tax=Albugo laibachii Nc14 TaxID=890382 RepID=F0WCN9_9STRA|nr:conserved hypothetical protein [Albugo laibachii Nc14]CCA24841.1 conserved hypothetical protein [Albugo laibachii Nc14]|eukprot:CCA24841.1 conserved hypothetical protein [Albugo laibachii Nc14]
MMARWQHERLIGQHAGHFEILQTDILTFGDHFAPIMEPCVLIALEVLDNLPHDKVSVRNGEWFETIVTSNGENTQRSGDPSPNTITEAERKLQDPLILQTIEYFGCDLPLNKHQSLRTSVVHWLRELMGEELELTKAFIPTGSIQLLNTIKSSFPRHRLIAADFDSLPPPHLCRSSPIKPLYHPMSQTSLCSGTLHAANAPIVASKVQGETVDHDTYLIQKGDVDILFATDFERLKKAYCQVQGCPSDNVSIVKSSAFLKTFADTRKTRTISRYNPMVEDFSNTSFLLS